MSDFKSKLPDMKELTSMTKKLFSGIKNSVGEIVHDYKEKRAKPETETQPAEKEKSEKPNTAGKSKKSEKSE